MRAMVTAAAAILAGVVGAIAPRPVMAEVTSFTTFNFAGVCTNCSGISRGELTLSNYTLGQQVSNTNFVSFHYDGGGLVSAFTITNAGSPGDYGGTLLAPFPSINENIYFGDGSHFFETHSGGWFQGRGEGAFIETYGASYTWFVAATDVPEPASLVLLGFSVAGILATRRSRAA